MLLFLTQTSFAQEPAPSGCQLGQYDHLVLWEELRELSRAEGSSIGVAAEGSTCQRALDTAIRSGPFPGVHRVKLGTTDRCVATVRPGIDGYSLGLNEACRTAALEPEEPMVGADRVVTVAWWLPVGASARWNEDLGGGISGVVDLAFREPHVEEMDAFGLYFYAPIELMAASRQIRLLGGLDLGRRGLDGGYLGVRGGGQWVRPQLYGDGLTVSGPRMGALDGGRAGAGLLSAVIGHKWVDDALVAQIGAGIEAGIPFTAQPTRAWIAPILELGWAWEARIERRVERFGLSIQDSGSLSQ